MTYAEQCALNATISYLFRLIAPLGSISVPAAHAEIMQDFSHGDEWSEWGRGVVSHMVHNLLTGHQDGNKELDRNKALFEQQRQQEIGRHVAQLLTAGRDGPDKRIDGKE